MSSSRPGPWPPSGEQITITHGSHRATVVTVGAGLRSYSFGGRDLLDGFAEHEAADGARGQTLMPWPNRVRDGQWSWEGEDQQLAITEPAQHNAIHGLVRWLGWQVDAREDNSVRLTCASWPQLGYPWPLELAVTYRLDDDGLSVRQQMTNRGVRPAPVAAGAHPYLSAGTTRVDDAVLQLPAETWIPTGAQQAPIERRPVADTAYDLRSPRRIGATKIDYAFTDLQREADGRCHLRLTQDGAQTGVTFWVDESYPYVEVFTGDSLPDQERRRRGLGVEPMSAPPNALQDHRDLVLLAPEETWTGTWGIAPLP